MNFQKIVVPMGILVAVAVAWYEYRWMGVMAVVGAVMMWLLLHWTRMMQVLRRAADTPVGYVGSAVMLNAKLKPGATLLHVVAMTRSLGLLQSPPDTQPEVYRWTDGSDSSVTATFVGGKLQSWELQRPAAADEATASAAPAAIEAPAPAPVPAPAPAQD